MSDTAKSAIELLVTSVVLGGLAVWNLKSGRANVVGGFWANSAQNPVGFWVSTVMLGLASFACFIVAILVVFPIGI